MSATALQEVKERGLTLGNAKVLAVLQGSKTQERVIVNAPAWLKRMKPDMSNAVAGKAFGVTPCLFVPCADGSQQRLRNPWDWPDDEGAKRLWVREVLQCDDHGMFYGADGTRRLDAAIIPGDLKRIAEFNDPFHMPRWASRITLEITNVRVERLQDISEADAMAEGMRRHDASKVFSTGADLSCYATAREAFAHGWDSINRKRGFSFESNVFVWVIEFRKL